NGAPITITANVGGTLINKTLTLSSDAQISQSDQICYLLFSAPCVSVAGGTGQGLAGGGLTQTLQEQLLGSVGSQITSLLVADTWLDYATVQTGGLYGNGSGAGQTDFLSSSFLSQTEVQAGKYLGQNLFVSITQPLGSRLPGAALEWQFRQDWTLEARTENRFGRGMLTLGSDALNAQRMWGLFLFREWGF
ncbi:MAG: translocation/assembly module TamB domain-containing protein, partial [Candidatus Palauibacterales bacterium]|nr:translocation/assembly module TamB domain-containing protein [Candidatus Palauibacterales bacterium]